MQILMLGNSLTTANDLPEALGTMLGAHVDVHARGGARLAEHLNPETRLGALTQQAFAQRTCDYVVLQESSNGPVVHRARFLEAAAQLCEQAREAGAQPVLYATWAYAPTCPKLGKMGISHDEMHERLCDAYREAARANDALIAEVGQAFRDHASSESLYRSDGVHPSAKGTALAAEVLASCLETAQDHALPRQQPEDERSPYTVYIVRCEDGSLYTGITTDVERRFQEHASRGPKAARYTRTHPVVALEATWETPDRASASALEFRIKRLSHAEKLELIANPNLIERLRR